MCGRMSSCSFFTSSSICPSPPPRGAIATTGLPSLASGPSPTCSSGAHASASSTALRSPTRCLTSGRRSRRMASICAQPSATTRRRSAQTARSSAPSSTLPSTRLCVISVDHALEHPLLLPPISAISAISVMSVDAALDQTVLSRGSHNACILLCASSHVHAFNALSGTCIVCAAGPLPGRLAVLLGK